MWVICHKSGTRLFTTNDEFTALNRAQYGWVVKNMQELKVYKSHPLAHIPTYATQGSACFDIYAAIDEPYWCCVGEPVIVPTGLKFDIPEGWVLMVYSRSGHGFKNDVRLANCVGIIDSDYTGELMVKLTQDVDDIKPFRIDHGDRIAQGMLMPVTHVRMVEINKAPDKKGNRDGGMGSTGK